MIRIQLMTTTTRKDSLDITIKSFLFWKIRCLNQWLWWSRITQICQFSCLLNKKIINNLLHKSISNIDQYSCLASYWPSKSLYIINNRTKTLAYRFHELIEMFFFRWPNVWNPTSNIMKKVRNEKQALNMLNCGKDEFISQKTVYWFPYSVDFLFRSHLFILDSTIRTHFLYWESMCGSGDVSKFIDRCSMTDISFLCMCVCYWEKRAQIKIGNVCWQRHTKTHTYQHNNLWVSCVFAWYIKRFIWTIRQFRMEFAIRYTYTAHGKIYPASSSI